VSAAAASSLEPPPVAARRPLRVVHLTTSYPRDEGDYAGRFVADLVSDLRERGVEASVLAPGEYRDFGLAYGDGVVANVRRRPWLAPALAVSMATAVRRAAGDADLVHAHWLAGGAIAALARVPFAVTLHGSGTAGRFADLELAREHPRLVRTVLRRARTVICVSDALAEAAAACGARDVRVIRNGVAIPDRVGREAEPAEVLFAGRLAPEKGIQELAAATEGLNLVVAGDGPLRSLLPSALGFVPRSELDRLYARAAVVVLPSHREGLPLCVLEAMAHGRPVVATAVGGIPELVEDGVTGLLVPPGDPRALRAALDRLLADPVLRTRLGREGRRRVSTLCSRDRVADATLRAYSAEPEIRVARPPRLRVAG
jgi:glycosyltransferase involved in cell wall biosynthesis